MMAKPKLDVLPGLLIILSLPLLVAVGEAAAFEFANRDNGVMVSSGERREYLLHVPPGHDNSKPSALVISLHGAALWGAAQRDISQWDAVADREGFIVVYPSGVAGRGPRVWRADGGANLAKDVRFISPAIRSIR